MKLGKRKKGIFNLIYLRGDIDRIDNVKVMIGREACLENEIVGLPHYKPTDKINHFDYYQKIGDELKKLSLSPIRFSAGISDEPRSDTPIPILQIKYCPQCNDKNIRVFDPSDYAAVMSAPYTEDISAIELRVDKNRNFELFINGASIGTATDSTNPYYYSIQVLT